MRRFPVMQVGAVLLAVAAIATITTAAPTAKENADQDVYPVIYSVADLPVFRTEGDATGAKFDASVIVALIEKSVAPESWSTEENPNGPASIAEFKDNLSLVVSQTQKNHEQVTDLLRELRKNQRPEPKLTGAGEGPSVAR